MSVNKPLNITRLILIAHLYSDILDKILFYEEQKNILAGSSYYSVNNL